MSGEQIDPDGKVPVYRQLAAILAARIESGRYPPGRRIPSKREAIEEFGVADKTYDRAVGVMREAGLVETVRGKGSYVTG